MRDPRIDFFRGLAIYMIFVDHVSGDPLAKFTFHMLGFSDAAELFVFISGLACGIAYSRVFARHGFSVLTLSIIKRAGRIYLYYVLSSVAMILIVITAMKYMELPNSFGVSADQPMPAISSAVFLLSPPHLSGILVLYIIFTLIIVPALLISQGQIRNLMLAVSGMAWLACQFFSDYTAPLTHRLFLNPLAWQFLFAIGVTLGIERESKQPLWPNLLRLRWAVKVAWAVVLGAFLYRIIVANSGFNVASWKMDDAIANTMKENLSPLRLVHFLSVALLVAVYFRQDSPFLNWTIAKSLITTGMHSLDVFSLSVVVTVMVNIVVLTSGPSLSDRLIIDSIVFVLLALTAAALEHRRAVALR